MMYPSFNWWTGVVETRHDPLKMGRCKVRIVCYHSPGMRKMPTDSLPWAVPMMPINSAAQTGVGWSPTGPVEGTHVVGFFRDGEDGQEPVMMGTLPGIPKKGGDKKGRPFMDNRWRTVESMYEPGGDDGGFVKNMSTGQPDIEGVLPRRPASFVFTQKGQQIDANATAVTINNTFKLWELDPTPYPSKRLIQMPTIPRTALGYDDGSSTGGGSVLFHLFSGATMFGAFFIITDPVSSAVSNKGRLIFGAMVGILVYLIRVHGNYPDAVAFGVLLLNFAAPLIDQYTQPTVYGTKKVEADE